jgi:EAL domain-containing protein (putative c-di-GMP-specific phosphodiesterase class I)
VVLEISEHEEVSDYAIVREALLGWRAPGLRLAVDDTGAGFSSLRHVLELAPDFIKLDISLVQGFYLGNAQAAGAQAMPAPRRAAPAVIRL